MAGNETEQVRHLQRTLYRTAKQSQAVKFYSLYDKVYRKDVLAYAYERCQANGGAAGQIVDADLSSYLDMASYCPQIHEVLSNRFG